MEKMLTLINYVLVLLFGVFVSVLLSGGSNSKKEHLKIVLFSLLSLTIQGSCTILFGVAFTTKLYPLITHLPLILFLVLVLKKPCSIAITSVLTAYFCCQLPFWTGILSQELFYTYDVYQYTYTIMIFVFFFLIWYFFAKPAHQAMIYSKKSLFLIGFLPAVYYIFDYVTTVYTDVLYNANLKIMNEFFPTVMVLFYIWFIVVYREEVQQRTKIQMEKNMLSMQIGNAKTQLSVLRSAQEQAKIYRHDMRHHITMIDSFVQRGELDQIKEYLALAQHQLTEITPMYFCENEIVNLILSSFMNKVKEQAAVLDIKADIPKELNILDTELCSVILNGLENALHAVCKIQDETKRNILFDCSVKKNMLLIKISNPYIGEVQMEDGVPYSNEVDHGYGCKSIKSISNNRKGYCSFMASDGIFTLKVALPY
ncbi:MAG: GHKL domain-containing protein [Erysipelotrichaceae bacterium]